VVYRDKVLEIAKIMNVKVCSCDIEACHRLKTRKNNKGPKRTIVRFVNRKICDNFHRNKRTLNEKKKQLRDIGISNSVYINCNLSPYNKFLWGKCKKLYDEKFINRFWVFNGSLFISITENDYGIKIDHINKLMSEFPGYDFDTKF